MTQAISKAVGPTHGFGLYIHWPYCTRICPYCDFNVYAAKDRDRTELVDAICDDIQHYREQLPEHPALTSIFFGGGTPSLLAPSEIERIIRVAGQAFGLDTNAECAIEANPNDVNAAKLSAWRSAGLNRVSLGIQSLEDDVLSFLGRDHDARSAQHAIEATASEFDNFSLDLIYARPGQDLASWTSELNAVLQWAPPHLSLYELTIEPATPFGKRAARGTLIPMEDDRQADLYEATQDICDAAGLPAYEVSNHARAPTYQSRHNKTYWASGDWIGVGPGAHGRLTRSGERIATEATRRPADYVRDRATSVESLSSLDITREFIAMGLRDTQGINLERLACLGYVPDADTVEELQRMKLVGLDPFRLALTRDGRLLADRITEMLSP